MRHPLTIQSPENALCAFRRRLCDDGTPVGCALLSALIAAVLAYHLLVIYGRGNADAVCEGLYFYTGADWALACGRWATRYMNAAAGNVVMPGIWVLLYALCCGGTAVILSRLWQIRSPISVALMSALLTVNPTVIEQSLLQYMFMAWGISNLLAALFVFLNAKERGKISRYVAAPLCLAVAFGLYQACVGMVCVLYCMTLILRLLRGESLKDTLLDVARFALSAVIGTLLYFLVMRFEVARWGVAGSYRMEEFSLKAIFAQLSSSVPGAYRNYLAYFADARLHRRWFFGALFVLGAAFLLTALVGMLRHGRIAEAAAAFLLALLIPAFSHAADIIFPYNTPVLIMQYQSMMAVPFALALLDRYAEDKRLRAQGSRWAAQLLLLALSWTFIVSANATYQVYELTYKHTNFVIGSVLNQIYALPDYSEDEVIAFAGFPDDALLRQKIGSYRYAYGQQYENLVFWDGMLGLQNSRQCYLLDEFGIEGGHIYGIQYNTAIATEQFKNMPVWPKAGSIARINDMIVVKFCENPTYFG